MVECKEKTCFKISYLTKKEAQTVVNRLKQVKVFNRKIGEFSRKRRKNHNDKQKRLQKAYKCPLCNLWHTTSQK